MTTASNADGQVRPSGGTYSLHYVRDALWTHDPAWPPIDHSVPNTAGDVISLITFAKYRTAQIQVHWLFLLVAQFSLFEECNRRVTRQIFPLQEFSIDRNSTRLNSS